MGELSSFMEAQKEWSLRTFGLGRRTLGICKHIKKELLEIEENPSDSGEWLDVVILALDGAWRAGYEPTEIMAALETKQQINFGRRWGSWPHDDEISEHIHE